MVTGSTYLCHLRRQTRVRVSRSLTGHSRLEWNFRVCFTTGVCDENEEGASRIGGRAIINKQTHRYAIGRRVRFTLRGGSFCLSLRLSPIRNASVRASPATFDRCALRVAFYFTFFLGSG